MRNNGTSVVSSFHKDDFTTFTKDKSATADEEKTSMSTLQLKRSFSLSKLAGPVQ